MPAFFHRENRNGVPANALWVSNGSIQIFLILALLYGQSYLDLIYLATSMILIPYFFSAIYAVMIAVRGEGYGQADPQRNWDMLIGALAVAYSVWLLYAAGLKYLLLSALLYAPGAIVYAKARIENGQPVFNDIEKMYFAAALIGAAYAGYGLYKGTLTI